MKLPQISEYILNNGFKSILCEDKSNPIVSLQIYIKMGSCWEEAFEAGFSHFTEHLVFKSTKKFPHNSIMSKATFLGGQINAYTEFDSTCFYITLASEYVEDALEILSELVRFPNFSEKDFNSEKKVVLEELKQYQNDPEEFFLEEIPQIYFKNNPFKRPIIGNRENLLQSKPEDLRAFHKKWYHAGNSFLVVSGDFDSTNLKSLIQKYFGSWENTKILPKKITIEPEYHQTCVSLTKKVKNDFLAFVLPDVSELDEESYALNLIMKYFSIGKSSVLYKRLYLEEKLVRQVRVHSYTGIYPGISIIDVNPKLDADLMKIVKIFHEEVLKLYQNGINQIEIAKLKNSMIRSFGYSYEYMESFGMTIGAEEINGGYENFFKYQTKIQNLTKPYIDKIIKKYFDPDVLSLFHLGKEKISSDVKSILKNNIKKVMPFINKVVNQIELDNGIKVFMKKIPTKPTVGICMSYEVSQLNESYKDRGKNLLAFGSLMHGTQKRSYEEIIEYCQQNGMQLGISPSIETSSVRLKCFQDDIESAMNLVAEVIKYPLFKPERVKHLQQNFINEFKRAKDFPQSYAAYLWKSQIFGKKSNLLNKMGPVSNFSKLTPLSVKKWYENHRDVNKMQMTVIGNFQTEKVIEILNKNFADIHFDGEEFSQRIEYQPHKQYSFSKFGQDQSVIHIGGFACNAMETKENTAFHLLAQIIGGDFNSRMFNSLREEQGLAYSVGFDYLSTRQLGNWVAYTIVDKESEKKALDEIKNILNDIRKNGCTDLELQTAKNYLKGQRIFEQESVLSQASYISALSVMGFDYDYYMNREKRIDEVTKDDIKNLAEKYFVEENFYIHILG